MWRCDVNIIAFNVKEKKKSKKLKVTRYLGEDSWGDNLVNTRHMGAITMNASMMLLDLDQQLVNTEDYMGMAYFWSREYRHYLRDATDSQRRRIHKQLLTEGLEVDGESKRHMEIIQKITGLA
jgi:hypothetical protein